MPEHDLMLFGQMPLLDMLALAWFLVGAVGYTAVADQIAWGKRPMAVVLTDYRLRWMERMLERENRIADVQIITAYIRADSLFISTTLIVLAGVFAVLGQIDHLQALIQDLSMAHAASRRVLELRVFVLILVFVYAFFKFAWSLRQFNYILVMIGAAPVPSQCAPAFSQQFTSRLALLLTRATNNYNRGIRAYYFAMALLPWFLHPAFLFATTVWVILVLSRRDFRSVTLKTLSDLSQAEARDPVVIGTKAPGEGPG